MAPPSENDGFSALGGLGCRSVLRNFLSGVHVSVGDFLTPVPNVEKSAKVCEDNVPEVGWPTTRSATVRLPLRQSFDPLLIFQGLLLDELVVCVYPRLASC